MGADLPAVYQKVVEPYGIRLQDCEPIRFATGDILFKQGAKSKMLYFLIQGRVHTQTFTKDGRKLSVSFSADEGVLGELELCLGVDEILTTITAETDLLCLAYPFERAAKLFYTDIRFSTRVAYDLAYKLTKNNRVCAQLLDTGRQRLCAYLLQEAKNDIFRASLTQTAAVLGISYRHLLRLLAELQANGYLRKEGNGYHICDRAALALLL